MASIVPRVRPIMDRYCRVCMAKDPPELISLFQIHNSEDDVIANMIIDCTEVMVSDDDNLPQNICSECLVRLNQAYQLRKQCQRSDEAFRAMLLAAEPESERASEDYSFRFSEHSFLSALHPAHFHILQSKEQYHLVEIVGFRCCGCDQVFVTEQELKLHSSKAHMNQEKVMPRSPTHECATCGTCFPSRIELTDHKNALKYQYYACRMCHLMLDTEDSMVEHVKDVHNIDRLPLEEKYEEALVRSSDSIQMEEDDIYKEEEIEYLDEDADYLDYASNDQNVEPNSAKSISGDKTGFPDDLPDQRFVYRVEEFLSFKIYHVRGERCCDCFQLFEDSESLLLHCSREHGDHQKEAEPVKHQCNVCFRRFDCSINLAEHRQRAKSKSLYYCMLCYLTLPDELTFLKHLLSTDNHDEIINTVTLDGKFETTNTNGSRCCGCSKVFKNDMDLQEHVTENHKLNQSSACSKDDFECDSCYRRFAAADLLALHKSDAQNRLFYRCCSEGCGYQTIHRREIIGHLATPNSHGRSSPRKQTKTCSKDDQTADRFACCVGRCYEIFNSYEALESHAKVVHELLRIQHTQDRGTDKVVCSVCMKGFNSQEAYERHRALDKSRKHVCLKCGAQYVSKSNLLQHERSKCGKVATFQCTYCDKAFMTMGGLRNHQDVHSKKRSFVCDLCGRGFLRKGILKDHMNTVHSKVRLFKCGLCPKSFSNRNVFQSHQATHTKEKPFQCRHCEKRYFKTSDRTLHENQVHLGIRPFKCNYCTASFIRDRERRLHERTHTKAKLYTCELCSEGYNKFAEYKNHRLTVHGLETLRDLGPAVMAALHGGQSDDGNSRETECKLEIEVYDADSNGIVCD